MGRASAPRKPEPSSFVIEKKYLSDEQIEAIKDNRNSGFEYAEEYPYEVTDCDHYITGWTSLDYFDIDLLFEKLDIKWEHIVWGQ